MQEIASDAFAPLDSCCYMRKATMDGVEGYVLMDCDGEVELFTDNRSECFFYAHNHELKVVLLN